MTGRRFAAVDVGSTRTKYAVLRADGSFVTQPQHRPTGEAPAETVVDIVGELDRAESIDAVSIVTTGLVHLETGSLSTFDTAEGEVIHDVPMARRSAEVHGYPTYLVNDCNAAAVGEWTFGVGEDYDCVVYVTIATGVGGGIVEDGRLLRGEHGQAGEVGMMCLEPFDGLVSTGIVGAWEAYTSGRGIPGFAKEVLEADDRESTLRNLDDLEAPDVFAAAAEDDPVAIEIVEQLGRYNAAGLGSVCNVVNPGIVTLGGGVVLNNPEVVLDAIEPHLEDFVYVEPPRIEVTDLGQHLELLGAVAYADLDTSRPYRAD